MKFPTPTLDMIKQKQKTGDWKATPFESIDPTSLDQKEINVLLLASMELLGVQIEETKHLLQKQSENKEESLPLSGITVVSSKPAISKKPTVKKSKGV